MAVLRPLAASALAAEESVDADTVLQLAARSKPLAATVVADEVGVGWDTAVTDDPPCFGLSEPVVTRMLTVGDLFAHPSGLPDHAGDLLEDLGSDRRAILELQGQLPLEQFRTSHAYNNFGVTATAEAVAAAAGRAWAELSEGVLYRPLGMSSASLRFADYQARPNRARGHVRVDGEYEPRSSRDPDPKALLPALTPQIVSSPPSRAAMRSGFYGYGFNIGASPAGRVQFSHSGAFSLCAATDFVIIPSADSAIVALTSASPSGIPKTLTAEFADLVEFGRMRQDWRALYAEVFARMATPLGELARTDPPADSAPARPLSAYLGSYANGYWGPATVPERAGALKPTLDPREGVYPLTHWDGDVSTLAPRAENSTPGSISKAAFDGERLTLEYSDPEQMGTFTR